MITNGSLLKIFRYFCSEYFNLQNGSAFQLSINPQFQNGRTREPLPLLYKVK